MSVSDLLTNSSTLEYEPSPWVSQAAVGAFKVASYLTDPVCKSHEFFRHICIVDALNPQGSCLTNLVRKVILFIELIAWAALAVFTTLPGIGLRAFASYIQENPYIYIRGEAERKVLPPHRTFSLFSWNVCCVGAGYAISDGGVIPWSSRIEEIIDRIVEKDADVNCLYETFDSQSAFYLCEKLKERGYAHFYFNIGPKAIGVTSGIFVASKYNIKNPEFSLFPQDTLVGRTKNAAKGVFAFDLESQGEEFARIYSTHLQHSEEPEFPTIEEIQARKRQMEIIVNKVDAVRERCVVITGDLNLDDGEYRASFWHQRFQKGDDFIGKTWGGDAFCASLVGKRISAPLNLDHTMVLNGIIRTSLVETGYEATHFKQEALSDHTGLFSRITVF